MNFQTFDLNLLRVLDALLRDGSTVKAARRLSVSQPGVSAALGRLRHALGDELFLRRGNGLEPTDYALALATPLRAALDGLESLLAGPAMFDPATARLSFTVAGSDFFAELLMPMLADRLSQEAPGIRLHLVDLVPGSHVDVLERDAAHIALAPDTDLPDWTDSQPVFLSSFVMVARSGHPDLAGVSPGEAPSIDLFCELGHVLFSPQGRSQAMGDDALARVGRRRRVVMTQPVFSGVCRAVAASDLVGLLPRQLAETAGRRMGLEIYEPPMPIEPATISMIWRRRSTNSPAHRWLRERIAATLEPLDEGRAAR